MSAMPLCPYCRTELYGVGEMSLVYTRIAHDETGLACAECGYAFIFPFGPQRVVPPVAGSAGEGGATT